MANYWTFPPQDVLEETYTADVREAMPSPLGRIVGRPVDDVGRTFRLRYSLVTSADCQAMAQFYSARRGAFEAFFWTNPNDGFFYLVRFHATVLNPQLWTPIFFRLGNDILLTVVSS